MKEKINSQQIIPICMKRSQWIYGPVILSESMQKKNPFPSVWFRTGGMGKIFELASSIRYKTLFPG